MKIKKKTLLHTAATAIIFMVCLLMPVMCLADPGEWTWISGANVIDQLGVYGVKGAAAAANVPGARYDSCSWTDASGDLWLFGGIDFNGGVRNDLWRYDSTADEWTWMSGSDTVDQLGVYGILGVSDAANAPGARSGAVSWIDEDGDLWLFGGQGYDSNGQVEVCHSDFGNIDGWLNDMWRYDTSESEWSWEDGSDDMTDYDEKGYYDDKGYPQSYVKPGAREGAISWTDDFGFMWMFGGYGWQHREYFETDDDDVWCWYKDDPCEVCPDPGVLNDLWVYNRLTNEWAWVSGSDDVDELGSYGIMGEATFDNVPGARMGSIPWIDKDNNLWLFGGAGKDSDVPDGFIRRMTDLWRYDPVTKMWTFVNGFEVGDQPGVYDESIGALLPGCREESSSWVDNDDNLWLLGGVRSGQHVFTHWWSSE